MKAKKLLIIAGNMGSGKTTLSKLLEKATGWKYLSIDYYRDRYNVQDFVMNNEANLAFIDDLQTHEFIIYETTSWSRNYRLVRKLINLHKIKSLTIKLNCPMEVCNQRINRRAQINPLFKNTRTWDSLAEMEESLKTVEGQELDSENHTAEELSCFILKEFFGENDVQTFPK
jgi:adenylate kinase family enzyme